MNENIVAAMNGLQRQLHPFRQYKPTQPVNLKESSALRTTPFRCLLSPQQTRASPRSESAGEAHAGQKPAQSALLESSACFATSTLEQHT